MNSIGFYFINGCIIGTNFTLSPKCLSLTMYSFYNDYSILDSYHSLDKKIQATFRHVFVDGVEEEWRACFITPSIQRLEAFMEKARSLLYSDPETALCEEMNVE